MTVDFKFFFHGISPLFLKIIHFGISTSLLIIKTHVPFFIETQAFPHLKHLNLNFNEHKRDRNNLKFHLSAEDLLETLQDSENLFSKISHKHKSNP